MNDTCEELTRPRRGRPPKHLKALKEMERNREGSQLGQDVNRKDGRISLEPHEIGLNNQRIGVNVSTIENDELLCSSYQLDRLASEEVEGGQIVQLVENPAHPDSADHVKTEKEKQDIDSANGFLGADRKGWKRKSTIDEGKAPVFKKPRGRPKGSSNRTPTGKKLMLHFVQCSECTCILVW